MPHRPVAAAAARLGGRAEAWLAREGWSSRQRWGVEAEREFARVDPDAHEVTFRGALDSRAPVAQGWLRASHRKLDPERSTPYRPYHTHDELQPLVPGEVYEVDVEIWPTSIVIPPGYILTLTIQGHDFERPEEMVGVGPWQAFRGSGPFLHNDPWDRRPEVYGGRVRIYGGGPTPSFLLLPVVPRD